MPKCENESRESVLPDELQFNFVLLVKQDVENRALGQNTIVPMKDVTSEKNVTIIVT